MTQRVILDWSSYQGVPNAPAIKAAHPEVKGVIIKATEGNWKFTNPFFDAQYATAKQAGWATGFYCFEHPGIAGVADADIFLSRISGHAVELGVWLDAETSDGVPPTQTLGRLVEDANEIARRYPMKTGFYSAPWWWDPNVIGGVAAHMEHWPFWIAAYQTSLPRLPVPWTHPLLWQFTDRYPVVPGGCDASLFTGDDKQWEWMLSGHVPGPPVKPPDPVKVKRTQHTLHASEDGVFGPDTDRRCEVVKVLRVIAQRSNAAKVKNFQAVAGLPQNGHWDETTGHGWASIVAELQRDWGVNPVNGQWDAQTDKVYLLINPLR